MHVGILFLPFLCVCVNLCTMWILSSGRTVDYCFLAPPNGWEMEMLNGARTNTTRIRELIQCWRKLLFSFWGADENTSEVINLYWLLGPWKLFWPTKTYHFSIVQAAIIVLGRLTVCTTLTLELALEDKYKKYKRSTLYNFLYIVCLDCIHYKTSVVLFFNCLWCLKNHSIGSELYMPWASKQVWLR
jgi:hypothetical protein